MKTIIKNQLIFFLFEKHLMKKLFRNRFDIYILQLKKIKCNNI